MPSGPPVLCMGVRGSQQRADGGNCGHLLCGRCLRNLPLCILLLLPVPFTPLSLLFLSPVTLCDVLRSSLFGHYCGIFSAVHSVASLAVLTMQRQREGNSAVSKLTWTDAGRPEGQKEKADEEEEGEETERQRQSHRQRGRVNLL